MSTSVSLSFRGFRKDAVSVRDRLAEWKARRGGNAATEYELYDHETDPHETRNLATEQPEVVERLKQILAEYPAPAE